MVRKIAWPIVILIIGGIAQARFHLINNHFIFHVFTWGLMAWAAFSLVLHVFASSRSKELPEFVIGQLYNTQPCYPLKSAGEQRAACAESLFLIGDTGRYPTSISYINSLEQLDLTNQEDIKEARLLMNTAWDIDNDRKLRKVIRKLINNSIDFSHFYLNSVAAKERYIDFLQQQGLPFQNVDACPITGFDLVRASWLTRIGFSVGYIDEREARGFLNIIGDLIQQQFSSWEQLTASYLIMYLEWNGAWKGALGVLRTPFVAKNHFQGAKLLLEDNNSPFRTFEFPVCRT